jgi:hypothetical protein
MNDVPDGFEPTDDPQVFDYNPLGFVPTPDDQALVDAAIRNALELEAIPEAERDYVDDPDKYAAPIGFLTEDEERERERRRAAETDA